MFRSVLDVKQCSFGVDGTSWHAVISGETGDLPQLPIIASFFSSLPLWEPMHEIRYNILFPLLNEPARIFSPQDREFSSGRRR